jgi:hypothetical protein
VRAIIHPKRDLLDPIEDPNPGESGFNLTFNGKESQGEQPISHFIEKVYVHPMLGEDSMMLQTVKEINKRFDVAGIPVVADKIEALGPNIMLPPTVN